MTKKAPARTPDKALDLADRKVLAAQLVADVFAAYARIGSAEWLARFAASQPKVFAELFLARFLPPPPKEDPDQLTLNQQINNYGNMSEREIATRIAFTLQKAAADIQLEQALVISPQEACRVPESARPPFVEEKEKVTQRDDEERRRYFEELAKSPEEKLVADTREKGLWGSDPYRGSCPEEQRRSVDRPTPVRTKRETVREKNRRSLL